MIKKKTDEQLQHEMNLHSRNAIELLQNSHKLHQDSALLGMVANHQEHSQILMKMAIEFQRLAIVEEKEVTRLQKILFRRQQKRMAKQKADF